MKFYNRINELKNLNKDIKDSKEHFIFKVFSGIRRIGKTSLITKVLNETETRHLYLYITHSKHITVLIGEIKDISKQSLGLDLDSKNTLKEVFEELFIFGTKNHYILVIDEFQNFEYIDKSFFGDFQYLIDTYGVGATNQSKNGLSKMLLICTGSYVSLINKIFSTPTAPLFRRADANIKIKELNFRYVLEICRDYGLKFNDALKMYALFGGIPYYYEKVIKNNLHTKNINEIFKNMFLLLEKEKAKLILETELKGSQLSFAILEGISLGNNSKKELMQYLFGKKLKEIEYKNKYRSIELIINNLIDLEIVSNKQKVPKNPNKSSISRYFIANKFFKIYFKYVYKNSSLAEEGSFDFILEIFKRDFEKDLGFVYEEVVREFLLTGKYLLKFSQLGKWWKGSKDEIDIVGVNELDNFILGVECKYSTKKKGVIELEKLQKRVELIEWENKNTKTNLLYLVVSHSGFTKEAIEYARLNKIDLLDSDDLVF